MAASSSSPGTPSFLGSAPIARITVLAQELLVADDDPVQAAVADSSTAVASSVMKRVPKRSAWSRNCCIISGPMTPSG